MGMTYKQFAAERGVTPDAVRIQRRKLLPNAPFSAEAEMSQEEMQLLQHVGTGKRSIVRPAKRLIRSKVTAVQVAEPAPAAAPKKRDWVGGAVLVGSTVVTLASLTLTCEELYHVATWFGLTLGISFAAFLGQAVLVARDHTRGNTSDQALKTLLWCEVIAAFLHCYNFSQTANIPNEWGRYAFSALAAAFVAVISYQSVILLRNFNAEPHEVKTQQVEQ